MKRKQPESRHRWGAFAVCMRVHLHNTQELFTAHLRSSPLPFTVRVSDRSSSWWVSAAAYAFRKSTVVKSASDILARGREPSCCLPYTMAFPSAGKRRGCRMARQNAADGTCWWGGLQLKFPEWNHTEQNSSGVSRSRNHFTHDHSRVTLGLMTCPVTACSCTQYLRSSAQPKLAVGQCCQRASSTGSHQNRCGTQPSTTLPWMRQATSPSKERWRWCPHCELWAGAERAKLQPGRAPASPSALGPVGWEVLSCSRAPFRRVWGRPGCSCPLAASCFLCLCQQCD